MLYLLLRNLATIDALHTIYIYIYIYIFTNLLSTSIHGDKEKEKKTPEFRDNKSRITAWGKKKKIIGRKKKKSQLRHTS